MDDNEDGKSILKYVGIFGFVYFILCLFLGLFLSLIHAEYYQTILVIGSSAAFAAYRFLEDNRRIFFTSEKFRMIVGSFLCVLITNLIFSARAKMMYGKGIGFAFIFIQVIDLFILWFVFGPVAKNVYQRRQQS